MALTEEAVTLLRGQGHKGGVEYALDNLGWAALLRGDHERAEALHEQSLVLCKELGDRLIGSESLEGLACSAGIRGDGERAARLFGASEALREALSYRQVPGEHALREPYLMAARTSIASEVWETAWKEGHEMTFEEAVSYALREEMNI
jgi:hypothetical protein